MTASRKCFYAVLAASLAGGASLAANAADKAQAQSGANRPATVTVLRGTESVLGKRLAGASGENAGLIVDVLADETGRVRAAIVDYGGFLGIGSRRIAISWSDLRFGPDGHPNAVAVDISSERLAHAPEVKAGRPVLAISARRPAWHRWARK